MVEALVRFPSGHPLERADKTAFNLALDRFHRDRDTRQGNEEDALIRALSIFFENLKCPNCGSINREYRRRLSYGHNDHGPCGDDWHRGKVRDAFGEL